MSTYVFNTVRYLTLARKIINLSFDSVMAMLSESVMAMLGESVKAMLSERGATAGAP